LQLLTTVTAIKDPSTLTFQLTVMIQGQQVQFLVDSGSTHSFLNSKFLPQFSLV
jgi:predicted aspartyl protease